MLQESKMTVTTITFAIVLFPFQSSVDYEQFFFLRKNCWHWNGEQNKPIYFFTDGLPLQMKMKYVK